MSAPTSILVDARVGWGSGIGRYIGNVVPRVAGNMPDVHFRVLVGPKHLDAAAGAFAGIPNLDVERCDVVPFSAAEQLRLSRHARGHALTWFTNYWVPLAWRGRFVTTVHDLMHLDAAIFPSGNVKRRLARATFAKVARDAAGILFVSRFSRRIFAERFGLNQRHAVTHLGVDHRGWAAPASDEVPPKESRLLVVAAAKAHKNFPVVLDAWARARVSAEWSLTIITPDDAGLRSMINLKLERGVNRVEHRRAVSEEALLDLYERSAIVLMPSLYEGFGLPLLEGLARGALCIASPAEAMVEIASGASVRFVNGRDPDGWTAAIEESTALLDARDPAVAVAQRCNMAHAACFSWDRTAQATATLLREALRA